MNLSEEVGVRQSSILIVAHCLPGSRAFTRATGKGENMRNATIAGIVTLVLGLWALPCVAQRDRGYYPPGTYVDTCRNIYMQGNQLVAECQKRNGDWRRTSLANADQCNGGIVNLDGRLACGGDNGYNGGYNQGNYRRGWQNGLPPGDYVQTCRNISMNGDRLQAECQERDGDWRRTSLDNADRCNGIANDNGRLVCGQGQGSGYGYGYGNGGRDRDSGYRGGIPAGTYTQTCRNVSVQGDRLVAECQKRNGDWRQTSLDDFQRCTSAPANDDGRLVCGGR